MKLLSKRLIRKSSVQIFLRSYIIDRGVARFPTSKTTGGQERNIYSFIIIIFSIFLTFFLIFFLNLVRVGGLPNAHREGHGYATVNWSGNKTEYNLPNLCIMFRNLDQSQ